MRADGMEYEHLSSIVTRTKHRTCRDAARAELLRRRIAAGEKLLKLLREPTPESDFVLQGLVELHRVRAGKNPPVGAAICRSCASV